MTTPTAAPVDGAIYGQPSRPFRQRKFSEVASEVYAFARHLPDGAERVAVFQTINGIWDQLLALEATMRAMRKVKSS